MEISAIFNKSDLSDTQIRIKFDLIKGIKQRNDQLDQMENRLFRTINQSLGR